MNKQSIMCDNITNSQYLQTTIMQLRRNTLCTSGLVDEVLFSRNGANVPESITTLCFARFARWWHRRRSLPSPTVSCFLCYPSLSRIPRNRTHGELEPFSVDWTPNQQ